MRRIDRTGDIGVNNQGDDMKIKVYRSGRDIDVEFKDGTVVHNMKYENFKRGEIANPNKPSVCGVGFIGQGDYKSTYKGSQSRIYSIWKDMIRRCYDKKMQEKYTSYIGCVIEDYFHNYQNFAKFYLDNIWGANIRLSPDKDLLCHMRDNKLYSRDTVCFVPTEINNLFVKRDKLRGECPIGVVYYKGKYMAGINIKGKTKYIGLFETETEAFLAYKEAKENHIKEVADKYNSMYTDFPQKIYRAMYEYEVDIND